MLRRARMQVRRCAQPFVCAVLVCALSWAQAGAAPYSQLFVFGDSLSDSGNAFLGTSHGLLPSPIPGSPYFDGRFSNGVNFADHLNQRLFGQLLLPSLAGGTDFAVGGATTGTGNNAAPQLASGMLVQKNWFVGTLGSGNADPNGLYLVYGGSNDVLGAVAQFEQDPASGAAIRNQAVSQAMDNLQELIATLADKGAQHFLIPNLPDIGRIPRFTGKAADASFASAASVQFNAALDDLLDGFAGLDIRRLNVYGAFNAAREPGSGFGNTTGACYTGPLTGGPPAPCADPHAFLFWDDLHPSARTHALLGDLAYAAAVPEPQAWMLALLGIALAAWRARQRREGIDVSVGLRSSRMSSIRI